MLKIFLNSFKKLYRSNYFWAVGISILIILLVLRESWFCDDAFFTFRNSLNLHYGFGPVWNPGEKIQNYTNILWMFLISIANRGCISLLSKNINAFSLRSFISSKISKVFFSLAD